jgi:phosphocarrier protein HPr
MASAKPELTDKGHRIGVTIPNQLGLHLRPASALVKLAGQFESCEIFLTKDDQTVNAKSIMGVIMLAAEYGSTLIIESTGNESDEAVLAIAELVESGFGE